MLRLQSAVNRDATERVTFPVSIAFFVLIALLPGGVWGALVTLNLSTAPAMPWAVPVMAILLGAMVWYLLGYGPPSGTRALRATCLRWHKISRSQWHWSVVAGGASIVSLAGLWIVLSTLSHWQPNRLPSIGSLSPVTVVGFIIMGSLVAPLSEEAAYRGYLQVPLEQRFAGTTAVLVTSILFACAHITHGLIPLKLLVYFLGRVYFGTLALMTGSILPGIVAHIATDLTFFILVWPGDARRAMGGGHPTIDPWFTVHCTQTVTFAAIAVWGFVRLRRAPSAV